MVLSVEGLNKLNDAAGWVRDADARARPIVLNQIVLNPIALNRERDILRARKLDRASQSRFSRAV